MASVLVIRKSAIPSLPENVRKYVEEFFVERKIMGVECMSAQRHCYHPSGSSYSKWGKGMAPSHSVDLMRFGKSEDGEVNEAIRKASERRPEDVFELCAEDRAPSPSECDD